MKNREVKKGKQTLSIFSCENYSKKTFLSQVLLVFQSCNLKRIKAPPKPLLCSSCEFHKELVFPAARAKNIEIFLVIHQ